MQRCDNLVDFEKRCKMSIWTQKSALIQLRTSLLKFDDLAEKSEKSSVSNFSTKEWTDGKYGCPKGDAAAALRKTANIAVHRRA